MSKLNSYQYHIPPVWAVAAAAALFVLLAVQVVATGGSFVDAPVYGAVSKLICPPLTAVVKVLTQFGGTTLLVVLCVITCLLFWRLWGWRLVVVNGANLFLASYCNKLIKVLVQRPRPAVEHLVEQGGFSFPSGHSLSAMVFYGLIALILLNRLPGKKGRWAAALLGVLILLVGLSRIYVGVHFASDVLAGLCEGFIWLGLITRIPWVKGAITGRKEN